MMDFVQWFLLKIGVKMKLDRNKMIGFGIIGGGILAIIMVVAFFFGGDLFGGDEVEFISFQKGDVISFQYDDGQTVQNFEMQVNDIVKRPYDVFDLENTNNNIVLQIDVGIRNLNDFTFVSNGKDDFAAIFDLKNKVPGSDFKSSDNSLNLKSHKEINIYTSQDLEIIPNGTQGFSLLFLIPRDAEEFQFIVNSGLKVYFYNIK